MTLLFQEVPPQKTKNPPRFDGALFATPANQRKKKPKDRPAVPGEGKSFVYRTAEITRKAAKLRVYMRAANVIDQKAVDVDRPFKRCTPEEAFKRALGMVDKCVI